jgi:hypothetical protein
MPVKDTKQYKFALKIFSLTLLINVNIQQKVCVLAYRYTEGQMEGCMDGWVVEWMDWWVDEWMHGW